MFQNLWYNGSLALGGVVPGVGKVSMEEPRSTFGGGSWFSDGERLVAILYEESMALDETRFVYGGKQAAEPGNLFQGKQVPPPNDRLHIQKDGNLTVATAVPSAEETKQVFDLDLYAKNVQPVWVQVENSSDSTVYLTPMGLDQGDPLNLAFVGDVNDLYYAFMRAGWDETETIYGNSLFKTAASALSGERYRYSPVSALYVFGRAQDTAMQRARSSINERNHLRVWLTPLRHEGKPVWIGQISRDIGVHLTWRTITTHKIDPDVDETREFLLEDLAFSQAVKRFGHVGGTGAAPYEQPRGNLTGDPYFTDGRRVVMWLSGEPVGLDEVEVLDLAPRATGVTAP